VARKARLALKVDVDTLRGTREGAPRLVELLKKHSAGATFLFSLGPDHTGRAIRRAFRPGFFGKVKRTSVVEHYGVQTLLYGTVLPGPDIGRRAAKEMLRVRDQGFEAGIHCWDHVRWQDGVAEADAQWTRSELERACNRFASVFSGPAKVHGAAGWQTNVHALRLAERLGFAYCSDTRGSCPFMPVWQGEPFTCPQLPTTLPTLDELIGTDGLTPENVAERLLDMTAKPPKTGHVYTLHAELDGGRWAGAFEALLAGWKAQGYELVPLSAIAESLNSSMLPRHEIERGSVPGRSGELAVQGREFLKAA
jgi:peptidoglycan/xylan/chitin deacetylase (PgdA/CDA1 family)